jgi:phospholipid-translocating ATPase
MILSIVLVTIEQEKRLVATSFTVLILNELIMTGLGVDTWHKYMIIGEVATLSFYFGSIPFLGDYYGIFFE